MYNLGGGGGGSTPQNSSMNIMGKKCAKKFIARNLIFVYRSEKSVLMVLTPVREYRLTS